MVKNICAADAAKLLTNHKEPVILALRLNNTVATRRTCGPEALWCHRKKKK
nr:MAG TPA: hypothetical protein [Caudoviricetes sp.]